MSMRPCPGCVATAGPLTYIPPTMPLCASCLKYLTENDELMRVYTQFGVDQMEASLKHHAEFDQWLEVHKAHNKEGA